MKRFGLLLLVAAVAMSVGVVYADSSACGGEPVLQEGDPTTGAGALTICLSGTPIQGSVTVAGDANAQTGYVDADGDESNAATHPCLDGYVRGNSDGTINSAPDGAWVEDAVDKDLPTFLNDLAADCPPA